MCTRTYTGALLSACAITSTGRKYAFLCEPAHNNDFGWAKLEVVTPTHYTLPALLQSVCTLYVADCIKQQEKEFSKGAQCLQDYVESKLLERLSTRY